MILLAKSQKNASLISKTMARLSFCVFRVKIVVVHRKVRFHS
jgi:hypothetical protein